MPSPTTPSSPTGPSSTYRLQITSSFTLDDAADLTGYLAELGVGAVYCSPLLSSTTGSDHGYDVTDVTRVDPQRGGEDGWRRFVDAARAAGLAIVVDIVPNHLGIDVPHENPTWWSVLRDGQDSPYAAWYDIDWSRPITLPVLGDDAGPDDLEIVAVDDGYELHYCDHRFPLAPGTVGDGDPVAQVLARQHYRLIGWRLGDTDLSYRRFFAVSSLAGVRIEDDAVFDATHERVLRWVAEDGIDGLRIDHPDGLVDPTGYFDRLRDAAPQTWIVAEKILEPGEPWPTRWPISGTTGYDAMTEVGQLFVDPAAEPELTRLYAELTGDTATAAEQMATGKQRVAKVLFTAEVRRILAALGLAEDAPGYEATDRALRAVAAAFEVYRTYLPLSAEALDAALTHARTEHPELERALTELDPRLHDPAEEAARRFQQLTGPVLAKGLEDTAWYRYNRFVAFNEVGGDLERFGLPLPDFHAAMSVRQQTLPESMTTLSTHDTKRSEDVRARLAALSEIPHAWAGFAREVLAHPVPDPGLVYLLAQTLAVVGRIDPERMHAYAEKAMREAAVHTGWAEPEADFEQRVHAFVDTCLTDPGLGDHLDRLLAVLRPAGWTNALGQKLVQLTMPGVPDVYQGTELWDDSLVDPDNRRPVDFATRTGLLGGLAEPPPIDGTGAAKLWLVRQALRLRRDRPDLFTGYTPVPVDGPSADHLVAFDRGGAITLATRLSIRLADAGGWRDTAVRLPDGGWTDQLSGERHAGVVRVDDLLDAYPVALLARDAD